jgi:hypothetical protein
MLIFLWKKIGLENLITLLCDEHTPAAERQNPDFLIGARNKKQPKKKVDY